MRRAGVLGMRRIPTLLAEPVVGSDSSWAISLHGNALLTVESDFGGGSLTLHYRARRLRRIGP